MAYRSKATLLKALRVATVDFGNAGMQAFGGLPR
jgi:hypothetical protein